MNNCQVHLDPICNKTNLRSYSSILKVHQFLLVLPLEWMRISTLCRLGTTLKQAHSIVCTCFSIAARVDMVSY